MKLANSVLSSILNLIHFTCKVIWVFHLLLKLSCWRHTKAFPRASMVASVSQWIWNFWCHFCCKTENFALILYFLSEPQLAALLTSRFESFNSHHLHYESFLPPSKILTGYCSVPSASWYWFCCPHCMILSDRDF